MQRISIETVRERTGASDDTIRSHFGKTSGEAAADAVLSFLMPRRCASGKWTTEKADAANRWYDELMQADATEKETRLKRSLDEKNLEVESLKVELQKRTQALTEITSEIVLLREQIAAKPKQTNVGLILAVVVLGIGSVVSVGRILADGLPVWWASYLIAIVVCFSPVLVLLSDRLTRGIAYGTIGLSFVIEAFCSAIAVLEKTETGNLPALVDALSSGWVDKVSFAACLGISLPLLSILFNILLFHDHNHSPKLNTRHE